MSEPKRFDSWTEVDCNDCAHYWDSSCDGVRCLANAPKKLCQSFLPTRSVVIPLQIKAILGHLKWLYGMIILEAIAIVICLFNSVGG